MFVLGMIGHDFTSKKPPENGGVFFTNKTRQFRSATDGDSIIKGQLSWAKPLTIWLVGWGCEDSAGLQLHVQLRKKVWDGIKRPINSRR